MNVFDRVAYSVAGEFESLDLSPVCALGTQRALGGIDQNNVLSALRQTEALGDLTQPMAIECARRRRAQASRAGSEVRLCASHRVIRLQPFDTSGFTPHFRLFGLVTAGRDTGSNAFELEHLCQHVRFYLELFRRLNAEGFRLTKPLVELSDLSVTEAMLASAGVSREEVREAVRAHVPGSSERFLKERNLALPSGGQDPAIELKGVAPAASIYRLGLVKSRVVDTLRREFPEAEFCFNLARLTGLGYYTGLCLRISPAAQDGVRHPIADGGFTDWTARLLQDKKERLLTSGIGSEFVCRAYRQ